MGVREGLVRLGGAIVLVSNVACAPAANSGAITYSTQGATANQVCTAVSGLSGKPVKVDRRLAGEVLVVDVKSVPLRQLVDRLAEALHAQTVSERNGYRITRPASLQAKLAAAELAESRVLVKTALRAPRKRLSELSFDRRGAGVFVGKLAAIARATSPHGYVGYDDRCKWLEEHSPVSRLLDRLIIERGEEALASMPVGEKKELSWTLGATELKSIALFQKEQSLLAEAVAKRLPNAARIMASSETDRLAHSTKIPTGSRLTLTIHKTAPSYLKGELEVKTPTGEYVTSHDAPYEGEKTDMEVWDTYPLPAWTKGLRTCPTPVGWDAKHLSNPEIYDPIGILAGPELLEIGRQARRQLVACLPDSAKSFADIGSLDKDLDLKRYLRELILGAGVEFLATTSWITVRPRRPLLCEAERLDRSALGNYLRPGLAAGCITVESLADIHYRTGGQYDDFAGPEIREALSLPYEFEGVHQSREFLDLLGSISAGSRKAMFQGKPLLASEMTDKQKTLLRAYWETPIEVNPGSMFTAAKPVKLPPFPAVLPKAACLKVEDSSVEVWFFTPKAGGRAYPASPEFMAAVDVLVERKAKGYENLSNLVYYPGKKKSRTYTVDLGGGITRSLTYERLGEPDTSAGIARGQMLSAQSEAGRKLRKDYGKLKSENLYFILQDALRVRYER